MSLKKILDLLEELRELNPKYKDWTTDDLIELSILEKVNKEWYNKSKEEVQE